VAKNFRNTAVWKFLRITRAFSTRTQNRFRVVRLAPIISKLAKVPDFPGSSASDKQWLELTLLGNQNTIPTLLELIELHGSSHRYDILTSKEIYGECECVAELRTIFDSHGSDKGSKHQYDIVYANITKEMRSQKISILEIGIGTNNTDIPSNMGKVGIPGASLRAWREYFPQAQITGCDVDHRILVTEDRIKSYKLDQTDDRSWDLFVHRLQGERFDLIVDDGLHAPFPNLMTVKRALPLLKKNGILVIEDILETSLPVWRLLQINLKNFWKVEIIQTHASNMVTIIRKE